ncbi:MAG: polysaccharide biosynthesis C-terminal domain-containing protein [Lachnospiraceae bacterium]|nr:polysaccharide biosynthesis C-terminal domain-containing protein [Lachnospiraceae bacterium]
MNENKGRYSYLFSNMALFTISNFVSKILVFLLVPFYTTYLSESEYGVADLMQTTLLLTVPILTVNIGESALRFALEGDDKNNIFDIGLRYVLKGIAIVGGLVFTAVCVGTFTGFLNDGLLKIYLIIFFVLYAADAFYEFMLLFSQGCDAVKIMICGSVSCTVLVIASNLIALLVLRTGLYGYLTAQVISFAGAGFLIYILMKREGYIGNASLDRKNEGYRALKGQMVSYGKGMQLYAASSWANNAIDRYFILFFLGSAVNGLYGVAYKIPAILTTFQRIFAQAFQMSAVKEYEGDDPENFFSTLYRIYNAVMVFGCAALVYILKPLAAFLFREGFFEAWVLVPPLLISIIFGALEGFLGSICLAYKDGRSMGRATGTGAVVNIVLNYILIGPFGAMGAAVATAISYFVMLVMAYIMVRKHIVLKTGFVKNLFCYALLGAESVVLITGIRYYYLYNALIILALCALYFKDFKEVYKKLMEKRSAKAEGK